MKRSRHCFVILFFLLLFVSKIVVAQGSPVDPGCDPDDPYCPMDSGLVVLLVMGAGYGAIKYIVLNKEKQKEPINS